MTARHNNAHSLFLPSIQNLPSVLAMALFRDAFLWQMTRQKGNYEGTEKESMENACIDLRHISFSNSLFVH